MSSCNRRLKSSRDSAPVMHTKGTVRSTWSIAITEEAASDRSEEPSVVRFAESKSCPRAQRPNLELPSICSGNILMRRLTGKGFGSLPQLATDPCRIEGSLKRTRIGQLQDRQAYVLGMASMQPTVGPAPDKGSHDSFGCCSACTSGLHIRCRSIGMHRLTGLERLSPFAQR